MVSAVARRTVWARGRCLQRIKKCVSEITVNTLLKASRLLLYMMFRFLHGQISDKLREQVYN